MSVITRNAMFEPVGVMVDPVEEQRIDSRSVHRLSGILLAFAASSLLWGLVAWGIGSGFAAMTQ